MNRCQKLSRLSPTIFGSFTQSRGYLFGVTSTTSLEAGDFFFFFFFKLIWKQLFASHLLNEKTAQIITTTTQIWIALLIGWKNSLARRVHHAREFCYVRLLPRRSQITFQKTLQGSFRLTLDFCHVLCRAHLREIYLCNIYRAVYLRIFNWHYKVTGLRDLHFSNNRSTFKVIFECLCPIADDVKSKT